MRASLKGTTEARTDTVFTPNRPPRPFLPPSTRRRPLRRFSFFVVFFTSSSSQAAIECQTTFVPSTSPCRASQQRRTKRGEPSRTGPRRSLCSLLVCSPPAIRVHSLRRPPVCPSDPFQTSRASLRTFRRVGKFPGTRSLSPLSRERRLLYADSFTLRPSHSSPRPSRLGCRVHPLLSPSPSPALALSFTPSPSHFLDSPSRDSSSTSTLLRPYDPRTSSSSTFYTLSSLPLPSKLSQSPTRTTFSPSPSHPAFFAS